MPWVKVGNINDNKTKVRYGKTYRKVGNIRDQIPQLKEKERKAKIQQNLQNVQAQAQKYTEEAKQANSFGGMFKNTLKAVPKAAADVIGGSLIKLGATALELPDTFRGKKASQREYKVPGFSPVQSFQSSIENAGVDYYTGDKTLKDKAKLSWEVAQLPLAVLEAVGVGKGISRGVKAFRGASGVSQGIKAAAPEVVDAFLPTTRGIKKQPVSTELGTGPKQGANKLYPSFLRSGERTLQNQGSTGQELVNILEKERIAEDLQTGKWKAFVNQFTGKLNKQQKSNLTDVLEGKAKPMDAQVAGSSKALRNWLDKVQRTAGEKGLDVGYRENYFPRKYNWSEMTKAGRKNEITQHLVDTGQASTRAEAEDFLNDFIFKNSQRKAGNLEYERMFDIPGYERDPEKALSMYAESAAKRLTQVEHFGAKDEVVSALINKIDKEGGDYKSAQKIFDYVYKGEDKNKFADALLAYNTFTKLSLGFFSNLTQSANTAAKGGIINTIKGAGQALVQGIKAIRHQKYDDIAVLSNSLDDYISLQESGLSNKFIKGAMYLFQKVENFNRRTAANTGVLKANQLSKVLSKDPQNATAIRQLESLGIKIEDIAKGKLTQEQLLTAANKMTKTTQFKMNALMMPQAWRTPLGKVLTQFKGFSFMQTKFIRDEIIKEAGKGNLAPLLRFLMIAPLASYATQSARNWVNQSKSQADFRKGDLYRKAVGDLPSDIASQMQYAMSKKDQWYTTPLVNVKNFTSPFFGPTASDSLQVASALEQKGNIQDKNETWYKNHPAAQQDPNLDLKRFGVSKIPFVGRRLANTTFGYKPTVAREAKDMALEAIKTNNQSMFNQALETDPYLKKEDALRAAIGKKVSEMSMIEKKFYEQIKTEAKKAKPYYLTK